MNFNEKIRKKCKEIPKGKVTTYKDLANAINSTAYRAVGNAMNKNPNGILNCQGKDMVPCHRVVGSDGSMTGFASGIPKKIKKLFIGPELSGW